MNGIRALGIGSASELGIRGGTRAAVGLLLTRSQNCSSARNKKSRPCMFRGSCCAPPGPPPSLRQDLGMQSPEIPGGLQRVSGWGSSRTVGSSEGSGRRQNLTHTSLKRADQVPSCKACSVCYLRRQKTLSRLLQYTSVGKLYSMDCTGGKNQGKLENYPFNVLNQFVGFK